jgi:hypothetical protein
MWPSGRGSLRHSPKLIPEEGFDVAKTASRDCAIAVSGTSSPHTIRGWRYCIKNLYATINATMLAKISSAGRDFRIIGLVEWRAADRLG